MRECNLNAIKRVLVLAFAVRLLTLMTIYIVSPNWSFGFLSNSFTQDDVRYQLGAMHYAEIANSLIDKDAFATAFAAYGDYTGYIKDIFSATSLWYWFTCIVYYCCHSLFILRLINIGFAIFAILYLFKFCDLCYGPKVALTSAKLLAFLPYPVVFSCFCYKDTLVMAITLYLIYNSIKYRKTKTITLKEVLYIGIGAIMLLLIRGGFSAILFVMCLILALFSKELLIKKHVIRNMLLLGLATLIALYIWSRSWNTIVLKFQSYIIGRNVSQEGGISFVSITSFKDLIKLPFTFLFAILMPIGFSFDFSSWFDIVSLLNICMAPIAIGATLDIILFHEDSTVFWSLLAYYCIAIISSIGIFRHYYSLLFIPLVMFSHHKHYALKSTKNIATMLSIILIVLLMLYFVF